MILNGNYTDTGPAHSTITSSGPILFNDNALLLYSTNALNWAGNFHSQNELWSLSYWIKVTGDIPSSGNSSVAYIFLGGTNTYGYYSFGTAIQNNGGTYTVYLGKARSMVYTDVSISYPLPNFTKNKWYHIVCQSYYNQYIRLWVNGSIADTKVGGVSTEQTGSSSNHIGSFSVYNGGNLALKKFRYYTNKFLNESEIALLYKDN